MPITITPQLPPRSWGRRLGDFLDRIVGRASVIQPQEPFNGYTYTLGVGVDWVVNGTRRVGFITVAHPYWERQHTQSRDTVIFPEADAYFWLRSLYISPQISGIDASLVELELLNNSAFPGTFPLGPAIANDDIRQQIYTKYCPNTSAPVVPLNEAAVHTTSQPLAFAGNGAIPTQSILNYYFPTVPTTQPNDPSSIATDPLNSSILIGASPFRGFRHMVRAEWQASLATTRFKKGYSGQPWLVNNQLIAIQTGAVQAVQPVASIGYGQMLTFIVQELDQQLQILPTMSGYQPQSLRVVSYF